MSHIIGRPNDGLLDIMLGQGADPEQAVIDAAEHAQEAGEGDEERVPGEEPTAPPP